MYELPTLNDSHVLAIIGTHPEEFFEVMKELEPYILIRAGATELEIKLKNSYVDLEELYMASIEIKEDTLSEIKILAKDFLDRSREDIDYPVKNPGDLETIGLRMVEVLFPKEYKEHYWRLMDAVYEEVMKEDKQ